MDGMNSSRSQNPDDVFEEHKAAGLGLGPEFSHLSMVDGRGHTSLLTAPSLALSDVKYV